MRSINITVSDIIAVTLSVQCVMVRKIFASIVVIMLTQLIDYTFYDIILL